MKLETFFEKFDLFAECPNAVQKMRELILELAVQGRLVDQDEGDEAAEILMGRLLNGERVFKIEKGELFSLPPTWAWARFSDVAEIASNLVNPKDFPDAVHLAPDNIGKGNGLLLPCSTVREDGVKSSNHRFFAGQIIYSKIRPNLSKVVLVGFDGLCSADMYPINSRIDARYLQYFMLSRPFLSQAVKSDTRIAMPKINQSELNKILVPVPPLSEQKRIVDKVDELMAFCDALEAQQDERKVKRVELAKASLAAFAEAPSPVSLDLLFNPSFAIDPADLRKAILRLAVQGRLVPQRESEDAKQLCQQIEASLSGEGGSSRVPRKARRQTDMAWEIPRNWVWVDFGDVMTNRDGERIPVSKEERARRAKIYDYYGASGVIDKIDDYLFDKPLLLIGEDGANLINRSSPIAFIARGKYWVNNHAHVLDAVSEDMLRYVEIQINAISLEPYLTGMAQPKMNQAKMNSIPLALPPLSEQKRIVAKVDELMALVDELEAKQKAAREMGERLLDAIVAELAGRAAA